MTTKALIDTNVIIDYLADRHPFAGQAESIFELCEHSELICVITASSATDIYYIMRKIIGREKTLESLKLLFSLFEVADVGKKDLFYSFDLPMTDFEDALVAVCAKKVQADCIITRNVSDFKNSFVPALSPIDFLARYFPDALTMI
jgi:predicted nucleic acid-binding protein